MKNISATDMYLYKEDAKELLLTGLNPGEVERSLVMNRKTPQPTAQEAVDMALKEIRESNPSFPFTGSVKNEFEKEYKKLISNLSNR